MKMNKQRLLDYANTLSDEDTVLVIFWEQNEFELYGDNDEALEITKSEWEELLDSRELQNAVQHACQIIEETIEEQVYNRA